MPIVEITKDNYEEKVMKAEGKVLLDFWATWCGPCKMIAPYVEQVAEECPHITVGKIDVDEQPALAMEFGITSIPTLVVMEKGEKVTQALGYRPKESILKLLGE
jgi:thioredoxin 1